MRMPLQLALSLSLAIGAGPAKGSDLFVTEFHVWFRADSARSPNSLAKWVGMQRGDPDQSRRRGLGQGLLKEYPVVGHYDSRDTAIQRWQLECLRNAGVTGVFVHLFPDKAGLGFENESVFASLLEISSRVGISLAVHDEAQFVRTAKAQSAAAFATRAAGFLARHGSHPAYLRRDGRPLYAFQFWNSWSPTRPSPASMDSAMASVETRLGQAPGWIVFASPTNPLSRNEHVWGVVPQSTQSRFTSDSPPHSRRSAFGSLLPARLLLPGRRLGLWIYASFDDSGLHTRRKLLPRDGGQTLRRDLEFASERNPDFILVSSWNDWMERSAIEPGSGTGPDPYAALRAIAQYRRTTFTVPQLPAGPSIDPLVATPPLSILQAQLSGRDLTIHLNGPSKGLEIVGWTPVGHPVSSRGSAGIDTVAIEDPAPDAWLEVLLSTGGGGSGLVRRGSSRYPIRCTTGTQSILLPDAREERGPGSRLQFQRVRGNTCRFQVLRLSSLKATDTLRTVPMNSRVHRIGDTPSHISHVSIHSSSTKGPWLLKLNR